MREFDPDRPDITDSPFTVDAGQEMMRTAVEGKISEVLYPRPGSDEPIQKVAFVTKIGDQICGVGGYN